MVESTNAFEPKEWGAKFLSKTSTVAGLISLHIKIVSAACRGQGHSLVDRGRKVVNLNH